jgi:hypothetical protein
MFGGHADLPGLLHARHDRDTSQNTAIAIRFPAAKHRSNKLKATASGHSVSRPFMVNRTATHTQMSASEHIWYQQTENGCIEQHANIANTG